MMSMAVRSGLALAGEVEHQLVLAARAFAAGLVEPGQKGAHIGGRAHHLVGGGQVGPTAEAENGGNLLPCGKQVEQNLLVGRVGAGVVGQKHALAQRGVGGKGHHRLHVGRVGGEGDAAFGVGGMAGEVVGGQAVELVGGGLDGLAALLDVAAELEREAGGFFVQGLEVVARGLVLVDAGQPVAEQGALDEMLRGGAGAVEARWRQARHKPRGSG